MHAIVLPHAEPLARPLVIHRHHVRILLRHPRRNRSGRRAHDHLDAGVGQEVHGVIQPVEPELALLRLEETPRELRHAHHIEPRALHQLHIPGPQLAVPVLRVIRRAIQKLLREHFAPSADLVSGTHATMAKGQHVGSAGRAPVGLALPHAVIARPADHAVPAPDAAYEPIAPFGRSRRRERGFHARCPHHCIPAIFALTARTRECNVPSVVGIHQAPLLERRRDLCLSSPHNSSHCHAPGAFRPEKRFDPYLPVSRPLSNGRPIAFPSRAICSARRDRIIRGGRAPYARPQAVHPQSIAGVVEP